MELYQAMYQDCPSEFSPLSFFLFLGAIIFISILMFLVSKISYKTKCVKNDIYRIVQISKSQFRVDKKDYLFGWDEFLLCRPNDFFSSPLIFDSILEAEKYIKQKEKLEFKEKLVKIVKF